jgi:hypothetical protein
VSRLAFRRTRCQECLLSLRFADFSNHLNVSARYYFTRIISWAGIVAGHLVSRFDGLGHSNLPEIVNF